MSNDYVVVLENNAHLDKELVLYFFRVLHSVQNFDEQYLNQLRTKVFFLSLHILNEILFNIDIWKQFKVGNHSLYF